MKFQVCLVSMLLAAPFASGATFLVDLNTTLTEGYPGGTWNAYAAPTNIDGSILVDSTGANSAVTLSRSGTINDHGGSVLDVYNPATTTNPSWVSAPGSNGAAGDYFFTDNGDNTNAHTFTLTFGGLVAGSAVSLDLLASRNSGSARGNFHYSLDNGATWLGFTVLNPDGSPATADGWSTNTTASQIFNLQTQGHAAHRYMNMSGTLAPGTSTFLVRTTDDTSVNGLFSGMNALRLTGSAIPEPSSSALLLLGAIGLVSRRRR